MCVVYRQWQPCASLVDVTTPPPVGPLGGNDADPVYRRVAADLREQIISSRLPEGTKLPIQEALARRYGVSRRTIRKALDVLSGEGLIDDRGQGKSGIVSDAATIPTALPDYIAAAFREPHVAIDAWVLTPGELCMAVRSQITAIASGALPPPLSIAIRCLVPDVDVRHPLPRAAADPEDPRPLSRLRNSILIPAGDLELCLTTDLRQTGLVEHVSARFRTLPTIPGEQRYIINTTQVLTGYYFLRHTTMHHLPDGAPVDILELHSDGRLFPDVPVGGPVTPAEHARFEQVTNWFDTRWDELSDPLPLPA
jgi:DNA-binding transcriptional regulator YhcF (GntR family)